MQGDNPMRQDHELFSEEQRFLPGRLAAALFFGILIGGGLLVASDLLRDLTGLVVALALVGFLAVARLVVRVSREALDVQFRPLIHRHIPLADISSCEARVYLPLGEYGGWGIRWSWKGKAYNVRGNRGVQLTLRSGESLLLGSQRAEELASAIRQQMQSA